MPRAIWSGTVSFGMVSIPVKLFSATDSKSGISFNQLHKKCHSKISEKRWCNTCDQEVQYDDLEKGYMYAKDQFVTIDESDLEKLPLPTKNLVDVSAFVQSEEIDATYFDKSYYLEPDKHAAKPYALMRDSLAEKGMIAIATISLRSKERICALRPFGGLLMLETLLYPDEIRVNEEMSVTDVTPTEAEMKMAGSLIDMMAQPFEPENYKDHYKEAMQSIIDSKLSGTTMEAKAPEAPTAKVLDLMAALQASLEQAKLAPKRLAAETAKSRNDVARKPKTSASRSVSKSNDAEKERAEEDAKPEPKKTSAKKSTKQGVA